MKQLKKHSLTNGIKKIIPFLIILNLSNHAHAFGLGGFSQGLDALYSYLTPVVVGVASISLLVGIILSYIDYDKHKHKMQTCFTLTIIAACGASIIKVIFSVFGGGQF